MPDSSSLCKALQKYQWYRHLSNLLSVRFPLIIPSAHVLVLPQHLAAESKNFQNSGLLLSPQKHLNPKPSVPKEGHTSCRNPYVNHLTCLQSRLHSRAIPVIPQTASRGLRYPSRSPTNIPNPLKSQYVP